MLQRFFLLLSIQYDKHILYIEMVVIKGSFQSSTSIANEYFRLFEPF